MTNNMGILTSGSVNCRPHSDFFALAETIKFIFLDFNIGFVCGFRM
jgi:hypothetical protein